MKRSHDWLVPALAALVAQAPALANGYVLDDGTLIVGNPYVEHAGGLKTLVTSGLFAASSMPLRVDYYRPLSGALNWLSFRVFHANAPGQHALNLALHVCVTLLVWKLLEAFDVPRRVATAAAVLFAVHPATPDIVAYLGGRQDMLGWCIVLGATLVIRRTRRAPLAALVAFAAFVAAVFSREAFVIAGLLLPWSALARPGEDKRDLRRAAAVAGGCIAGLAVALGVRAAFSIGFEPRTPHSLSERLGVFAAVLGRCVKDVVAPTDLAVDVAIFAAPVLAGVAAVAAVLVAVAATHRALRSTPTLHNLAIFGAIGAVGTVLTHGFVALRNHSFSDRYAYPVVLSAVLWLTPLVVAGISRHAASLEQSPLRKLFRALPYLVALALIPATWARARTWHDERRLQVQMYEDRPNDPNSKLAYGSLLASEGHYDRALPLCLAFVKAYPDTTHGDTCVAQSYLARRDYAHAIPYLRHYLTQRLSNGAARVALLNALAATNDWKQMRDVVEAWGPDMERYPEVRQAKRDLAARGLSTSR